MSHAETGMRAAGFWLALAAFLLGAALAFHGAPSPDFGVQMQLIADGSLRWSIVHWVAAAALSFFAVAGLVVLAAGSRLTEDWWTLSAWAVLPVGALWTVSTAIAEATVIFDAAISGNRVGFEAWWVFAEGMANGFAAMALAFTVIAVNETRAAAAVPVWASWIAAVAGAASFAGWVLGSWLDVAIGGAIWVVSSLVICLWLLWFGVTLARAGRSYAARQPGVTFRGK
jgi:hypothetical protein